MGMALHVVAPAGCRNLWDPCLRKAPPVGSARTPSVGLRPSDYVQRRDDRGAIRDDRRGKGNDKRCRIKGKGREVGELKIEN